MYARGSNSQLYKLFKFSCRARFKRRWRVGGGLNFLGTHFCEAKSDTIVSYVHKTATILYKSLVK